MISEALLVDLMSISDCLVGGENDTLMKMI